MSWAPRPSSPTNAGLNALNARSSSSGSPPVGAAGAVAAPVHRSGAGHAAQALRRHRALHRMERAAAADAERVRIGDDGAERIAEVPRQAVEVAEDVAARAGVVAVSRRAERVVEEAAADLRRRRRRIVAQRHDRGLRARRAVGVADHRDRVVDAIHDVEPVVGGVEDDAARALPDRHELLADGARFQRVGVDRRDLAGAEAGDEQRLPVGRERHVHRKREALVALRLRAGRDAEVHMPVQVARRRRGAVDDR